MPNLFRVLLLAIPALAATGSARAAEAPFEAKLIRLAEVLGSLHYLRNLCGETGSEWRDQMEALIAAENPDPPRKARFTASFNRGYRAYSEIYASCTPSAVEAIERYMKEGEALTHEIVVRYGN